MPEWKSLIEIEEMLFQDQKDKLIRNRVVGVDPTSYAVLQAIFRGALGYQTRLWTEREKLINLQKEEK